MEDRWTGLVAAARSGWLHCHRQATARLLRAGVVALGVAITCLAPAAALAQAPTAAAEPAALLESASKDLQAVRNVGDAALDDAAIQALRKRALSAQAKANDAADAMAPELAAVQARLAELGKVEAGVRESQDVAAQRAQLTRAVSELDSQIKLARLVALEAEQAAATAAAHRRLQFSARLEERGLSPLAPAFWIALAADAPADLDRLATAMARLRPNTAAMPGWMWLAIGAVVAAVLALAPVLQRLLLRFCTTRVPPGRLRRSLHAVGSIGVRTAAPGLMAHAVVVGLGAGDALSLPAARLLASIEAIVWFGGFVAGLGAALLMSRRPSWRLLPISDDTAATLRWFPVASAVAIVLGWVSTQLAEASDAGLMTTRALSGLASLTFAGLLGAALLQLQRRHREQAPQEIASTGATTGAGAEHAGATATPLWLPTARGLVALALLASLLATLLGYIALGNFLIGQLVWGLIVSSTAYLLAVLVDDLFMVLLAPTIPPPERAPPQGPRDAAATATARSGEHAAATPRSSEPAATPRSREHAAVLLSGLSRIAIALLALVLLMAPYGEGPMELVRRAGHINEGLSIGEVNVRPVALLQAVLVLVLGLLAVRLLKGWLAQRYMPTTRMDAGMRVSMTTLVGYVGVVLVVALAMSALGVGLERVAWVASALSVGIGFGLQAVVQNFVSGLILLAERPVKVGDWVSLSGVEGDIRRINVRATEIQMGDRSTVIVPNSEFITKIVRNVTYTDPLGMVQIKLPMPLATDTRTARALLLAAFDSHPGVLDAPAPAVQLDAIDAGNLVFIATGFVSSPRAAGGVRSDLLFDVLERFRDAGLPLARPPTMLLSQAPAAAPGGAAVNEPPPPSPPPPAGTPGPAAA